MVLRTIAVSTGTVTKSACCEACGCVFEYTLRRIGVGVGRLGLFSASNAASRDIDEALDKANAVVACPDCGHFQKQMIKRQRRFWLKLVLALGLCVGILVYLLGVIAYNSPIKKNPQTLLTVRYCFAIIGFSLTALAAVMFVIDEPQRFKFMRFLHRKRAKILQAGQFKEAVAAPAAPITSAYSQKLPQPAESDETSSFMPSADFAMESLEAEPVPQRVTIKCAGCGKKYRVDADKLGAKVRCVCGMVFKA